MGSTVRLPAALRCPFASAATVAAIALGSCPAGAIVVDGVQCTLVEAILAANAAGFDLGNGCGPGEVGADRIELDADVSLATPYGTLPNRGGVAGLPDVISAITIAARGGDTIERDAALGCAINDATAFRLFNVTGTGSLTLEGITLRNGCIAPPAGADGEGGAVLVEGSGASLTLVGGALVGNHVRGGQGGGGTGFEGRGGAVAAVSGAALVVEGTLLSANEARGGRSVTAGGNAQGGAIYLQAGNAEMSGATFEDNVAVGGRCTMACPGGYAFGGALRPLGGAITLVDSVLTGNFATGGQSAGGSAGTGLGGAVALADSGGALERLVLRNNVAEGGTSTDTSSGGGALGGGLYVAATAPPALVDSLVESNLARARGGGGASGGGAHLAGGIVEIRGTSFIHNSARGVPASSAIGAVGGGLSLVTGTGMATVVNSTLHDNWAAGSDHTGLSGVGGIAFGGAIYSAGGLTLSHVTAVANQAIAGSGTASYGVASGGGLYLAGTSATVDNSLLAGNLARGVGGEVAEDCWDQLGILTSRGYNLVEAPNDCQLAAAGDRTGPGVEVGLVLPPADLGCSTPLADGTCPPAIALGATSPAVDGGSCATSGLTTDQRGRTRPQGHPEATDADDGCDVGAFELEAEAESGFYTLTPCRVLDTRLPKDGPALASGSPRSVPFAGVCGVPTWASAVAINATVTGALAGGFVVLYPGGSTAPATSTVNFAALQTRANNAIVPLGSDTSLEALAQLAQPGTSVHLIVDVVGYFR